MERDGFSGQGREPLAPRGGMLTLDLVSGSAMIPAPRAALGEWAMQLDGNGGLGRDRFPRRKESPQERQKRLSYVKVRRAQVESAGVVR